MPLFKSFIALRTGAIRRAAVEKDMSPITYECFVNELDTGDSFTTTLVDILVKVSGIVLIQPHITC